MKASPLTRAVWTCEEAEDGLQDLLTKLTGLHKHIPENYERELCDILDEFYAAERRVQAVKYDLLICLRKTNENAQ